MVKKSERAPNILYKKLLDKMKVAMYFDSNVHRDGAKEEKSF